MVRAITVTIGVLALMGSTLGASAADLARKAPPVVAPPPPVFSWTGCYIGGQVGGKKGSIDGDANLGAFEDLPAATLLFNGSDSETGLIYGGQVGCNWQTGVFVLGVEGDFVGTDIERGFVVQDSVGGLVPGDAFSLSNNWQASLRGRLGWAFNQFMVYATGGVAWANFEVTAALVGEPFLFSSDKTLTGWTVGGGIEWAFTPNWSLGLEYRFSDFDRENFGFGALVTGVPLSVNSELETHELTARVNYRFNLFGITQY
jgi:outer membrane immunogenic protein